MKKSKMWSEFVFLVTIILTAEASLPDPIIIFKVRIESNTLTCDHSDDNKQQIEYTVLEGEQFTIVTNYDRIINHVICHAYKNENDSFHYQKTNIKNVIKLVEKSMGTFWNCTILTHRDNSVLKPLVHYNKVNYTAAYCFMKIHVRQKEPPQTMLVNNMVVRPARRDLSKKDVDFIAEYYYVDGDVVNVACVNFWMTTLLTMEYEMAGETSDNYTMKDISSRKRIGFVKKLHSGHNNSYMICTSTGTTDYTKVMIRFVIQTKPNIISVAIDGMILRPILIDQVNSYYEIQCMFGGYQDIKVTCEVEQEDMELDVDGYGSLTELILDKKTEVKRYLFPGHDYSLNCSAGNNRKRVMEFVYIMFTTAHFLTDRYPSMYMELPSNGTVIQLNSYGERKNTYFILYEFIDGETLQLTCGLLRALPAFTVCLQLNNTEICKSEGCNVSKTFQHLSREDVNTSIACYLKEERKHGAPSNTTNFVRKETRVILRERAVTAEPSTPTLSTTLTAGIVTDNTAADPVTSKPSTGSGYSSTLVYSLSAFGVVTVIIILVSLSYICIKKQYCVRASAPIPTPNIDPASVYYENLLSVFAPINQREAAEADREAMEAEREAGEAEQQEEHYYEEVH